MPFQNFRMEAGEDKPEACWRNDQSGSTKSGGYYLLERDKLKGCGSMFGARTADTASTAESNGDPKKNNYHDLKTSVPLLNFYKLNLGEAFVNEIPFYKTAYKAEDKLHLIADRRLY